MIVRWKMEMAGSPNIIEGSVEIDDDDEGPPPDDYIEEKVQEAAMEYVQITWRISP